MRCNICGAFYAPVKHARCPQCFPLPKPKAEQNEKSESVAETLNTGQLAMVYGETDEKN